MENPLASVIIAVYNGERFLAKAIESVQAQTYRPLELIVVDDGSIDGSAGVARSYEGIRYLYQTNQGQAAAMNAGVRAAQGEFIAFLDADDWWGPDKLAVQMQYLLEHPAVDCVIGQMKNMPEADGGLPLRRTRDLLLDEYAALCVGTLVARRAVFDQVGDFDANYRYAKDVDWFIRAREAGVRMDVVPVAFLYRRLHGSNDSYATPARTRDFLRAVKASIDRKRQHGPASPELGD
jgi:glycosyltransferase involved in cell wall biosynthesis